MREKKYKPKTRRELRDLVQDESIYLGDIDTSEITNMPNIFYGSTRKDYRGIETWDTSSVEDMSWMFNGATSFNQDLSGWDVSNVKDYRWAFDNCPIKEDFKPKFKRM